MALVPQKNKLGVDEFAPELMTLLRVAFNKEITIPVEKRSQAISMRYRLNLLKSRIRESDRQDLMHLKKVQVRVDPEPRGRDNADYPGPWHVIVGPPDLNLTPFIRAALQGHKVEDDTPDLSTLTTTEMVDTLPEGAGTPLKEVEHEPLPLPSTHIIKDE